MRRMFTLVLFLLCATSTLHADAAPYLHRLANQVVQWHGELNAMNASAQRAAEGVIAGGTIYATGPQPGFMSEASGRAGGLMMLEPYESTLELSTRDTILAAISHKNQLTEITALFEHAAKTGAQIVLFDAQGLAETDETVARFPGDAFASSDGVPVTSMSNVAGMWAWTGKLVAACVQRGMMPCVYQSYAIPDGRARAEYLRRHDDARFHAMSSINPASADTAGERYLDIIAASLREAMRCNESAFPRAAELLRASLDDSQTITLHARGHLYPAEFEHPHQPAGFVPAQQAGKDAPLGAALILWYQDFPWQMVSELQQAGRPIVLTCSQSPLATFTGEPQHVYINPVWPIEDGVVELEGYDVPLFPASGLMDTAIYWQLIELATQ